MEFGVILLLVLFNGVFAMAEIALISARRSRLEKLAEEGNDRAAAALALQADSARFLSTVQVGITLIGIVAGALGGAAVADNLQLEIAKIDLLEPYSKGLAFGLIVLLTTYLSLVLGELVPKQLALQNPERIASLLAKPMTALAVVGAPLVWLLSLSTDMVLWLLPFKGGQEPPITEADVEALLLQGTAHGVFEPGEAEMVTGVFSLGDLRVDDIMTPHTELKWLDLEEPWAVNSQIVMDNKHSYFPVCRGRLDGVVGVVGIKDLLRDALANQPIDLEAHAQPALFVPENQYAVMVLADFKRTGKHIALALGEFGEVTGLVTINDIIEEIVGDFEKNPNAIIQREDGTWLVDGLLPIYEFKEFFEVEALPGDSDREYQTLGGFVMFSIGRVPQAADRFAWGGLAFEVMDMDGKRVDKVLVTRSNPSG